MKKRIIIRKTYFIVSFLIIHTLVGYSQNCESGLQYLYTSKDFGCWYNNIDKPGEYNIAIRDNTPDSIIVKLQNHKGKFVNMEEENYYSSDLSVIYYYDDSTRMKILQEFLTFYGDTTHSSKSYFPYPGYGKYKPKEKDFTVQIEALYTFTSLLVGGYICCEPILIEKDTNEKVNTNQEKLRIIYNIYQKWLNENKETGFINYKLPLDGTPYMWKNETTYMKMFMGNHLFKPSKEFIRSYLKIEKKERGTIACTTFY